MNVSQRQDAELVVLIVEDMANQGYQVQMGRHRNGTGYFAQFWQPTTLQCFACDKFYKPDHWDDAGHASTLLDAVTEAREIALGIRRRPALPPAFFGHGDE